MVDNDPAQVLLAAQDAGLLTYLGFVRGNQYEVEAGGRHWTMPAAEVLLTVPRLRLVDEIARAGAELELVGIGDDGSYTLRLALKTIVLPEQDVIHWCQGFRAAFIGNGQQHTGVDTMGQIADLLERPDVNDQCRMVILGLMYGGDRTITSIQLAEMIGRLPGVDAAPVKKTITNALGFGRVLTDEMRELMIAAFGLRWVVTAGNGTYDSRGGRPAGRVAGKAAAKPLPEMPALARLRELVEAARKGWLRYLDRESPNEARRRMEYQLSIGSQQYTVNADALPAWLRGVRAFHEVVGGRQAAGPA